MEKLKHQAQQFYETEVKSKNNQTVDLHSKLCYFEYYSNDC